MRWPLKTYLFRGGTWLALVVGASFASLSLLVFSDGDSNLPSGIALPPGAESQATAPPATGDSASDAGLVAAATPSSPSDSVATLAQVAPTDLGSAGGAAPTPGGGGPTPGGGDGSGDGNGGGGGGPDGDQGGSAPPPQSPPDNPTPKEPPAKPPTPAPPPASPPRDDDDGDDDDGECKPDHDWDDDDHDWDDDDDWDDDESDHGNKGGNGNHYGWDHDDD